MLSSFRRLSKSKIGTAILVLFLLAIVASFALADMTSLGGGSLGSSSGTLASADDEPVTERDFSTAMERLLAAARQQNPEATYASIARDAPGVFEQLIDEAALRAFAKDQRLLPSRRLIDAEIAALPQTRGLDGKFSQEAYLQFLASQRMNDAQVRRLLGSDLIRRTLLGPVSANARVPVGVATQYASMLLEQREGELVLVLSDAYRGGLVPGASDIRSFYDQNRARYTVPEQRVLRIATIGPDQVAGIVPTEAEIAAYYTANKAAYAGREVRVISQAVLPSKPAADAIAARARSGATFAAAAAPAGLSAEDISVGPQTRAEFTSLAGEAVAAAAFGATRGAIVGPVRSDLGWHVIRIDDLRGEAGRTLAQARAEILARLTADKRKEALLDLVTRVEEKIEDGASLTEAAAAEKLKLTDTPLITAAGANRADPSFRLPAELAPAIKAGFELAADDDPVVETLPGEAGYVLVGVGRILPAAPAPLDQIRDRVAADWTSKMAADRARTAAAGIAARVAGGSALAEAARGAGAGVSPVQPIAARRIQLADAPADIAAPLRILFSLAAGKSRMVAEANGRGYFVVKANKVTPGNATLQPGLVTRVQTSFQQSASDEIAQQFLAALRADVGVKRNEKAFAAARARLTSGGN